VKPIRQLNNLLGAPNFWCGITSYDSEHGFESEFSIEHYPLAQVPQTLFPPSFTSVSLPSKMPKRFTRHYVSGYPYERNIGLQLTCSILTGSTSKSIR